MAKCKKVVLPLIVPIKNNFSCFAEEDKERIIVKKSQLNHKPLIITFLLDISQLCFVIIYYLFITNRVLIFASGNLRLFNCRHRCYFKPIDLFAHWTMDVFATRKHSNNFETLRVSMSFNQSTNQPLVLLTFFFRRTERLQREASPTCDPIVIESS